MNYENWCSDNGEVPLGIKAMKASFKHHTHAQDKVIRDGDSTRRRWVIDKPSDSKIKRSQLLDGVGLWVDPAKPEALKRKDTQGTLNIEGLA